MREVFRQRTGKSRYHYCRNSLHIRGQPKFLQHRIVLRSVRQPDTTFFHYSSGTSFLARELSLKWCGGLNALQYWLTEWLTVLHEKILVSSPDDWWVSNKQLFIVTFEYSLQQQRTEYDKANLQYAMALLASSYGAIE